MKKVFNIVLLILWMLFIFIMSNYSAVDSNNQSGAIVNIITSIIKIDNIDLITLLIRKMAHITEYLILGILMINVIKDYKINNKILVSILLCIIYSCSDEIHQLFIVGRSGQVIDIFIDTIGILLGIYAYKRLHISYI